MCRLHHICEGLAKRVFYLFVKSFCMKPLSFDQFFDLVYREFLQAIPSTSTRHDYFLKQW
jgi:hypothetical protein